MHASLRLCVRRSAPDHTVHGTRVSLRLPSDIACLEEAVSLVERHCFAGSPPNRHLRFRLQVALSEALANAIICGNRQRPDRFVFVEAEVGAETIRVSVTDQGEGFDPSRVPDPAAQSIDRTCGRGLFLIRKLSDGVQFNTQGNSICMTLRRR